MLYENKHKVKIIKNDAPKVQKFRFGTQIAFLALVLWIGVEFVLFYNSVYQSQESYISRPPGVDGFLPISSLMSVVLWLKSGQINMVHPAGFIIFMAILAVSVYAGKSFCSWMCPIGTISEMIAEFGEKIMGRKLNVPKWLDIPLRSLKYLILGFFIWVIVPMSASTLTAFLDSPYNKVAEIKLYLFFLEISLFAFVVILLLFIFSTFIRGFWCRYLCPYGALLGITGLFSPVKITRNATSCIDCGLCAKACPASIAVDKKVRVWSDECTSCLSCVDACPVKDTLFQQNIITGSKRSSWLTFAGIISIYLLITGAAVVTGYWQNSITQDEYRELMQIIDLIGH